MNPAEHIHSIRLEEGGRHIRSTEAEHERNVAIADLLDENLFDPLELECGPYDVVLKVEDNRLVFDITSVHGEKHIRVALPVSPLKRIIRDYFLICESYYDALKTNSCGKIEAIDMGRRGLHNEGAGILQEMLAAKITIDHATARRLFTLVCVLHLK
ncbi:MAG: UPF0262 family protein [Alphaproteobacteria bacterium]|nr:UPF0262 family protein [Alphaproteobacteria bacterium]